MLNLLTPPILHHRRVALAWLGGSLGLLALGGCASLTERDPLRVNVAGVRALPGEGLELRFEVRLRVQNPGETALDFDGLAIDLELRDLPFASGVSSERGSVPRFGEAVLAVPVTVSATALVRQGLSLMQGQQRNKRIGYRLRGRLGGTGLLSRRFDARGELDWPPAGAGAAPAS